MLNVGDRLVIANYGAGIIRSIEELNILGEDKVYLIIFIFAEDMDFFIPIDRIERYKIRELSSEDEMKEALELITEVPEKIEKNWNSRCNKYKKLINTGDIKKMCSALRDLNYLKSLETISNAEDGLYERAINIICGELMLMYDISLEEAKELIGKYIK